MRLNTLNDSPLIRCQPPFWARSGHLQTILGHLLPSPRWIKPLRRELVRLRDHEQLLALMREGDSPFCFLLFHGLTGSSDSSYIQRTALELDQKGHTIALINHRGCGEGRGLAGRPYHSGRGDDISDVVDWARASFSKKKIIVVGFSLSANAILTLLTGLRGESLPDGAIAVNGPIDLLQSAELLKKGVSRIYDYRFVQQCRSEIADRISRGLIPSPILIPRSAHLQDVDEAFTAPLGGFKSARDYYEQCSTASHLKKIKTPTVLIMSKDDPFIPFEPYLEASENPNIHLRLENTGGHMGYLAKRAGAPLGYDRWLDRALSFYSNELTRFLM